MDRLRGHRKWTAVHSIHLRHYLNRASSHTCRNKRIDLRGAHVEQRGRRAIERDHCVAECKRQLLNAIQIPGLRRTGQIRTADRHPQARRNAGSVSPRVDDRLNGGNWSGGDPSAGKTDG